MNPEIKQMWLEALRSGEYVQGKNALRSVDATGQDSYCCLGVLCDLNQQYGWSLKPDTEGWCFLDDSESLPQEIVEWAEVGSMNPFILKQPLVDKPWFPASQLALSANWTTLAMLNDSGVSFANIADIIEEQL